MSVAAAPPAGADTRRFSLSVQLLEDTHSGSGSTVHELDAVQQRDRYGNPVIRDRHLRGLLREQGLELVRMGMTTTRDVSRLFGQPGQDARSLVLIGSLRSMPESRHEMHHTSSTARHPLNRAPRDDTLRLVEHIPALTGLSTEMELLDPELAPLLERCVRRVRALGAKRTRGDGAILADLQPLTDTAAAKDDAVVGAPGEGTCRLRLLIRAEEPICMANTATPDNLIPTECYIRGQAVQGAFTSWALRRGLSAPAAQLLASDTAPEFINAYPLPILDPTDPIAALQSLDVRPIPLDAMTTKPPPQRDGSWPWWAENAPQHEQEDEADSKAKTKRPGDHEFLFRDNPSDSYTRYAPLIRPYMRNDAGHSQRTGNKQQLFTLKEIAEHTLFVTDISFVDPDQARAFERDFAAALQGHSWLTFGRGGGLARILKAQWLTSQPAARSKDAAPLSRLRVSLDSDLIMRAPLLGFRDKLDLDLLTHACGLDPEHADALVEDQGSCDTVETHGFNPVSALPRLPATAIRRGSVLAVTGPEEALHALSAALSARPALGERAHEGFGRIRVEASDPDIALQSQEDPTPDPLASLNDRALRRAEHDSRSIKRDGPSRSQWTSLAKQARAAASLQELKDLLATLQEHAKKLSGVPWEKVDLPAIKAGLAEIEAETSVTEEGPADEDRLAALRLREARLYLVALATLCRPEDTDGAGDHD